MVIIASLDNSAFHKYVAVSAPMPGLSTFVNSCSKGDSVCHDRHSSVVEVASIGGVVSTILGKIGVRYPRRDCYDEASTQLVEAYVVASDYQGLTIGSRCNGCGASGRSGLEAH